MLLCLACNLDPFAHRNSHSGRAPADGALALEPREALRLLSRSASTTLGHVKLTHARILRSRLSHDPAPSPPSSASTPPTAVSISPPASSPSSPTLPPSHGTS
ncbi:unnamed protein product [Musa acuminata var. zebrina]